jgi:mono/diheme cytochrome c family protein
MIRKQKCLSQKKKKPRYKNKKTEMKKLFWIINFLILVGMITGCNDIRRNTGRIYMPDMAYGRAYKTYAQMDSAKFTSDTLAIGKGKIFYNARPVNGAMARGDQMPFAYSMDKTGDTTNYIASKQAQNPLPQLNPGEMKEAERLYLVNCGVCHGPKLDGNGPLYKDGNGPFSAKPATLVGDPKYQAMPEGQMFFSITYGKNAMGSYASQITTKQRWMIIDYIKSQQAKSSAAKASAGKTDSTATKTK